MQSKFRNCRNDNVDLCFDRYGVRQAAERSGAYLFLPDGDAVPIQIENTIVNVIQGPIMSSVTVQLPYVRHTATLYSSTGTFDRHCAKALKGHAKKNILEFLLNNSKFQKFK